MRGWAKLAAAMAVAVALCVGGALPRLFAAPDAGVSGARYRSAPPGPASSRCCKIQAISIVAFEYASLSSQVGDYEAAISTLERMLIYRAQHAAAPARARHPLLQARQLRRGAHLFRASARQSERAAVDRRARSASICSSSPSKPSLRPSPDRSSAASAGRATPTPAPATQNITLNGIDFTLDSAVGRPLPTGAPSTSARFTTATI